MQRQLVGAYACGFHRITWMSSTQWSTSRTRWVLLMIFMLVYRLMRAVETLQGLLGTNSEFRKKCAFASAFTTCNSFLTPLACRYELPILAGREPGASDLQTVRGAERAAELSAAVDPFILRRTNALLSAHLPPKACCACIVCGCFAHFKLFLFLQVIQIVCCPLTSMQVRWQPLLLHCWFLCSRQRLCVMPRTGVHLRTLPAVEGGETGAQWQAVQGAASHQRCATCFLLICRSINLLTDILSCSAQEAVQPPEADLRHACAHH